MPRSDIPFATDDAHAFLPWIIGVMACMATLLLCLVLTMGGWIVDRHAAYADNFTVNIPAAEENTPDKISAVEAAVRATPGVTSVAPVSETSLRDMLKPWLGSEDSVNALPLPAVLEATVGNHAAVDYKALQAKLAAIAPGVDIDAHEIWVANFARFSTAAQWIMAVLAGLIVGSLGLMIAFTSRASLKLHAKTVQLLHSIGAEDRYIMRQFQREASRVTIYGAAPGCIAAGIAYLVGGKYIASLQSSILPSLAMTGPHLALLLLMPLACGIVAWLAARLAVTRQLRQVL